MRRSTAAFLVAMVLVAGCGDEGEEPRQAARAAHSGVVDVASAPGNVTARYAVGKSLYGQQGSKLELAGPVSPVLLGTLVPPVVPHPRDSGVLAYTSWRGRRPVVRLHDTSRRTDEILAEGALSTAWRRDGAVAYFRASTPDLEDPKRYRGHVVVRRLSSGPERRWTRTPGRYVVAAWARDRLLVYRLRPGWPDLLVLGGPRRVRLLARAGALVALSPDGRRAVVARYGASPAVVRLLGVGSGSELARVTLRRLRWMSESGSWEDGLVAAPSSAGIAVLRVHARSIELEQVLRFLPGTLFPVLEPRLSPSGERVSAWAQLESRPRQALPAAVVVECNRFTLRCERSADLPSEPGPRLVYNPSRP